MNTRCREEVASTEPKPGQAERRSASIHGLLQPEQRGEFNAEAACADPDRTVPAPVPKFRFHQLHTVLHHVRNSRTLASPGRPAIEGGPSGATSHASRVPPRPISLIHRGKRSPAGWAPAGSPAPAPRIFQRSGPALSSRAGMVAHSAQPAVEFSRPPISLEVGGKAPHRSRAHAAGEAPVYTGSSRPRQASGDKRPPPAGSSASPSAVLAQIRPKRGVGTA